MNLDFDAIFKAYNGTVVCIDESVGALDKDGKPVTLDQSKIDAARTAIDKELTDTKYQKDRAAEYPSVVDQLDLIYHSGIDAWKAKIKETKDKYPKP
jgi:hypothetical protein